MKILDRPTAFALLLTLAATGCITHALRTGPEAPLFPAIIEPRGAATELSDGREIVFLDLRLPEDRARIRVRGSRPVEFRAWQQKLRRDPADPDSLARWYEDLASLGVGPTTPVRILAGRGDYVDAGVVWYALQGVGVADVAVINGGFDHLAESLPERWLDRMPESPDPDPAPVGPVVFMRPVPSAAYSARMSKDEVRAVSAGSPLLIDTRTMPEFTGRADKWNPRKGCIPGAVNLPHTLMIDEGGRIRPRTEIIRIMADLGAGPDDPIVLYCQSGGRSAFVTMVLVHAGFRDVRNYIGSFGEWSRGEDCPVEADPLNR